MKQFYVTNNNNRWDQALIIEEETGRNVAVCYEKNDAPLLSAAPDLLEACKATMLRDDIVDCELGDQIRTAELIYATG